MNAPELLKKLDAEMNRIETPLPVIFNSPEDARALMYWITAPHLRQDPVWRERINPAILAIASALVSP